MKRWIAFMLVLVVVCAAGCAGSNYKFGDLSKSLYNKYQELPPERQKQIEDGLEKLIEKAIEWYQENK